jgi:ESAT-6 family protein
MDFDGLLVDHSGLEAGAQDLRCTVRDIEVRLNRLEADLGPLRSDWTGSAQQAYVSAKARWDSAMEEMRHLLEETSRNVTQSNADYRAADRRGAASFDR